MIISQSRVLKSSAGYYIGKTYLDEDMNTELPYSRDSQEYYATKELAEDALINDTYTTRLHP
tara:strand:- start:1529 stop:1714 length:186 start_codon:yes stop_codon:yes gene_type:complete